MTKQKTRAITFHQKGRTMGAGVEYGGTRYVTHCRLPLSQSAIYVVTKRQKIVLLIALAGLTLGIGLSPLGAGIALLSVLTVVYFSDFIFSLGLMFKSLDKPPEIEISQKEIDQLEDKKLPVYSILCPLYKEWEVLDQFVASINRLDWPKEKMDVLLLLEENDPQTLQKARELNLPDYFKIVVVPHSLPKTKPKACNYGLCLAQGEYLVIYDAEDVPDEKQLKKAYIAFSKVNGTTFCLQAKLNYYNSNFNWLTRLFTAEYSLWFDVILPGLQSINTTIPLGGTSNHFRTEGLRKIHGWDAFNVTEDCDLGVRIFKKGYKTAIFNSTTLEEANSNVKNWLRQRSRWIKGYWQTYLVHMRQPVKFFKSHGWQALAFQLVIGMRTTFIMINPVLWIITLSYFVFHQQIGNIIEALYPPLVFYVAAILIIFGNFFYLYSYMVGLAKRGYWNLIKYVFVIPVYWLLMSVSGVIAFYQLITNPYYWEKTHHGLHLAKQEWWKGWKEKLSPALTGGLVLVIASIIGGGLNIAYSSLLGKKLEPEQFGAMATLTNLFTGAGLIFSAVIDTVTHKSSRYLSEGKKLALPVWKKLRHRALIWGEVMMLGWLLTINLWQRYLQLNDILPLLIFSPVWVLGILAAVDKGFLSGDYQFKILGWLLVVELGIKLGLTVLGVQWGTSMALIYAIIPLSLLFPLIGSGTLIKKTYPSNGVSNSGPDMWGRFFNNTLIFNLALVVFLSLDVVLAKHYLSEIEAGKYALMTVLGKSIFTVTGLVSQFILPIGSRKNANGKKIIGWVAGVGLAAFVVFGVGGEMLAARFFGEKIAGLKWDFIKYSWGVLSFSLATAITMFNLAQRKYNQVMYSVVVAMGMVIGINYFHSNIDQITNVVMASGMGYLAVAGLAWGTTKSERKNKTIRVLIFNWRDKRHVWAGGAEVYLDELTKRLVKEGWEVSMFCGNDGKSPRYEKVDGVEIYRRGGFFTVYLWAPIYYWFRLRHKADIIIDSENGIPFFSPLFARKPIISVVYHVHQEVFRNSLGPVAAGIACFLEGRLMPLIYKNKQIVTVSKSSKLEMEELGLGQGRKIRVVCPGVAMDDIGITPKSKKPTILYLGRLKPYKSIDTIIKSMRLVIERIPEVRLNIAGFGESREELEKLAKGLGLKRYVRFLGKVSEKLKAELMARSWVFVCPSLMEGWGISVVEAYAAGTPVVAARVPGLVDSLSNPHSGFLVPPKDETAFANKITQLLKDDKLRQDLSQGGKIWAKQFSWTKSARQLKKIIIKTINDEKENN